MMARLTRKEIKSTCPVVRQLFELMDQDGRSFEEIANRAGYYPNMLSLWRTGKTRPVISTMVDVAQAIGYRIRLEKI